MHRNCCMLPMIAINTFVTSEVNGRPTSGFCWLHRKLWFHWSIENRIIIIIVLDWGRPETENLTSCIVVCPCVPFLVGIVLSVLLRILITLWYLQTHPTMVKRSPMYIDPLSLFYKIKKWFYWCRVIELPPTCYIIK